MFGSAGTSEEEEEYAGGNQPKKPTAGLFLLLIAHGERDRDGARQLMCESERVVMCESERVVERESVCALWRG